MVFENAYEKMIAFARRNRLHIVTYAKAFTFFRALWYDYG